MVWLEATWSLDRVAVDLTVQQDEDAGRDGEDRQDHAKATNAQKRYQAPRMRKMASKIMPIFLVMCMVVLLS